MSEDYSMRRELRSGDEVAVAAIVTSTNSFTKAEIDIAIELVAERRAKGIASGYYFLFLDDGEQPIGYVCHGPIAGTESSYDLYWIAVTHRLRGQGIGKHLLAEAERDIASAGGRRIYVDTSSRPDYAATRSFYERSGYQVVAQLPDFYADHDGKVIYCKLLAQ